MLAFYLAAIDTSEDRQFIAQLFDEYRQMMFSITYSILHHRYDAEEAVQNAFVNIMESNSLKMLKTFDIKRRESYISIAAKNAALKVYNRRKKNNENTADEYYIDSDNIDTTEEEALSSLGVMEIKSAIDILPENYRSILELHFLIGMSYDEIAGELNITSDNARQRIHRAKKHLEEILMKRGFNNDKG